MIRPGIQPNPPTLADSNRIADSLVYKVYQPEWDAVVNYFKKGHVDYVMFIDGVEEQKKLAAAYGERIVAKKLHELDSTTIILPYAQHGFGSTLNSYNLVQSSITASYHTVVTEPNLNANAGIILLTPGDSLVASRTLNYNRQQVLKREGEGIGPLTDHVFIIPAGEAARIVQNQTKDLGMLIRVFTDTSHDAHYSFWGNYLHVCATIFG